MATYVKHSLTVTCMPFPDLARAVHVWVQIRTGDNLLNILNCYYPEGDRDAEWINKIEEEGGRWLVAGDFNCRSILWEDECPFESALFRDKLVDSALVVLNDGSYTRIPDRADHRKTAIDLTLATPDVAGGAIWEVGEDPLSSDHLPVSISIDCEVDREINTPEDKYNYGTADWEAFREELRASPIATEGLSSEQLNDRITTNILAAADKTIPKCKPPNRKNYHPWWTKQCQESIKHKRKTYKIYKSNCNEENFKTMKQAQINSKKIIAEAKREYWREFVYERRVDEDLNEVWKKAKKLKHQYSPPDPVLEEEGIKYASRISKAEKLAEVFAAASSVEGLPPDMKNMRLAEERHILEDPVPDNSLPINQALGRHELDRALGNIKNVKVTEGPDRLSYKLLKELPENYKDLVLLLFDKCWVEGIVPAAWKVAIVTPIPKQGKNRKNPNNYRPISLTSHLGKVYERIIKERMNYYCEKKNIIPCCQAGFRRGRGVSDHLAKIASQVRRARARRRILFSCFFDVRRAYDSVWHRRILQKLSEIGLSGNIYNFVKSFIENRKIQVAWRGALSGHRTLEMGVPQGSVIAPLLFNLVTAGIDKAQVEGCALLVYADDVAICHETRMRKLSNLPRNPLFIQARKIFQSQIDKICEFMRDRGFVLSPQKTVLFITTGSTRNVYDPILSFDVAGVQVHPQSTAKYLGVTFSASGSWEAHINNNVMSAKRALNLIKSLSRTPWASPPKTMVILAQALVRSRLLYGHEAFFEAPKRLIEKLRIVECHALRIALGLPRSAPPYLVYRESGLLPLEEEIKRRSANYIYRSQSVPNSTTPFDLKQPTDFVCNDSDRKCQSAYNFVEDLVERGELREVEAAPRHPLHSAPPWTLLRQEISPEIEGVKKSDNPHIIKSITKEFISMNYDNRCHIYTDGSKCDVGVGAAFCVPELSYEKSFQLPPVSVFTSELVAIFMSLCYIKKAKAPLRSWVVLTDSRSALEALASDGASSREDLVRATVALLSDIRNNNVSVVLQWIPSHVGIAGNERADTLAKEAAEGKRGIQITLPLSYNDIASRIKTAAWESWRQKFREIAATRDPLDHSEPVPGGTFLRGTPLAVAHVVHRLRCNAWRARFIQDKCPCGENLSPHHVIFLCPKYRPIFDPVLQALGSPGHLREILCPQPTVGWAPAKTVAQALINIDIGRLF